MKMTLPKLLFALEAMMKKNSVVLHENCSCCGGSLQSLSFKELLELAGKIDTFSDKVIKFKLDKAQVYGLPIQYKNYPKIQNYLCKHLIEEEQFGDMLVFNDEEMANDYHETCKYYLRYG